MRPRLSSPDEPGGETALDNLGERLRELPNEVAPPFAWSELERRAALARRWGPLGIVMLHAPIRVRVAAALAACIIIAVAAGVLWTHSREPRFEVPPAELAQRSENLRLDSAVGGFPAPGAAALIARAAAAERWLSSTDEGSVIVHVSSSVAIGGLEDRIASIDDQLDAAQLQSAAEARLRTLRLERARLIADLAQVQYAETLAAATR